MKILHLATTYPLHLDASDAAFVEALVESLCGRGHEVHVLLPWHPRLQIERTGRSAVLHSFMTTPFKAWHPWGYAQALSADRSLRWDAYLATPYAVLAAARAMRKIMQRIDFDVVHANWLLPAGPIVALALRGIETPMVVSCHGSGVFLAEKSGWAASAARWGLDGADAVTACSRDLTHRVAALDAGPTPEWIPYGVDIDTFRPTTSERRRQQRQEIGDRLGVSPEAPWVLAVGRLVYKKGFENVVRAMAGVCERVPDAQLLIAGEGPLRGQLSGAAAECGVADAVHLPGAVPHGDLAALYSAADVIVVPSVHGPGGNVDGLPNVFLEGLASGTPVVASRIAGIPDIGRDGETVTLVGEGDIGGLARAIGELLGDPARRRAQGEAARADAEDRLAWGHVAARFENLYESVTHP